MVEDHAVIRMGAVSLVMAAGFDAIEASNADDAIRILEARSDIHLVFTDVDMPGTMDGMKLSHYVRDRWPSVKLIVASGTAIMDACQLPSGARFFCKPYRDTEVAGAIIEMLSDARDPHPASD